MLVFGLYHPKMPMPELGKKVAADYTGKTKNEPNRLLFQAADSLLRDCGGDQERRSRPSPTP